MSRHEMNDRELDKLLSLATRPLPTAGAHARLMNRISASSQPGSGAQIFVLPRRSAPVFSRPWLAALPLAASLAFGIWLGVFGLGSDLMSTLQGDSQFSAGLEGIEDVVNLAEDGLT